MDPYLGYEEFVTGRLAALSRTAYLLTGDHHLAEDLLQVALSRVAARWPQLRDGKPEAYIRKIMVNELLSWRRRRSFHERPAEQLGDRPDSHDLANTAVRRIVVGRALNQLAPRQRAVLVLRYFEDLSEVETAEILGCAVGTVKAHTHQALARLRAVAPELGNDVTAESEARA